MDMVTNGVIITGALDYVNGKAEKLKLVSGNTQTFDTTWDLLLSNLLMVILSPYFSVV